jgi:hypothetical protein
MVDNMCEICKRINELKHDLENNGYNTGFMIYEDDTYKFWQIFNEALKEFPIEDSDDYEGHANVNYLIDLLHKCLRWRDKWILCLK